MLLSKNIKINVVSNRVNYYKEKGYNCKKGDVI